MSATNYPKLFNFEISKESDSHFSFLGYLYRLFSFFQRCASITPSTSKPAIWYLYY